MPETALPLALVTGAAHRLGRAIALELARQGFAIGLHYHQSRAEAEQTAAELSAAGAVVYLLPADLAAPAEVEDLFNRVAQLPHPLRVLVNSAAVMPRGDLRTLPVELWDGVFDLNLRAPWLCARAAAALMESADGKPSVGPAERGGVGKPSVGPAGRGGDGKPSFGPAECGGDGKPSFDPAERGGLIINITDSGAHKTWTGYPAYVISKSALEALTRLLARALAPTVRVNAVAPGLILPAGDLPAEQWQRLVDRLPLQAAGQPADVARAVLFFIQNPYITGQVLAVDGGYQLV